MRRTAPSIWRITLALILGLALTACSSNGAPPAPGQYDVQHNSVHYDGDRYQLYWSDKSGSIHRLETRKLQMVRDDQRTYLDVPASGDPVLHITQDEPITVDGQDHQGGFSSFWFPFLVGSTLGGFGRSGGNTVIINQPAPGEAGSYGPTTPSYRYPPTDSFGRGDELHGSVDSSRAQPPDYSRVAPAPYAVSGQSSGAGGGVAATNKSGGFFCCLVVFAASGQSGGSGSGSAASSKGGFASGDQSYANKSSGSSGGVGAGSRGALGNGSSSSSSSSGGKSLGGGGSGSSSSKGIGGSRSSSGGRR